MVKTKILKMLKLEEKMVLKELKRIGFNEKIKKIDRQDVNGTIWYNITIETMAIFPNLKKIDYLTIRKKGFSIQNKNEFRIDVTIS